ncbi:MAG TPA: hypothetical protein DDW87_03905, partial [Firmicutes bacterium]|nr:hypothetical protein [Bacillota bacterium]
NAVAAYVRDCGRDVVIFPAGLEGKFSLEDTWCAGLILADLGAQELGDGARTAKLVCEQIDRHELVNTTHGKRLQNLGLHGDLAFCLELDRSSGVIIWDQASGWGALKR